MSEDRRMHRIDLGDTDEAARELVQAVRDAGDEAIVVMPSSTYQRIICAVPAPSQN